MNVLDYIFLAIIVVSALRCWFRGIITELLSASAVLAGLLSGIFFYQPAARWIGSLWPLGKLELVLGFLLAFAVVFIVIKLLEKILRDLLENLNLNILDKVLGLLLGIVEGVIISSVIIILLQYQPLFNTETLLSDSFISRILLPLVAQGIQHLPASGESILKSKH